MNRSTSRPVPIIFNSMGLRICSRVGEFVDSEGQLIAYDPSVHTRGPGALLVRREQFPVFLDKAGLQLAWTLIGEKHRIGGDDRASLGWLQVSDAFRKGSARKNCSHHSVTTGEYSPS